MIRPLLPLVIVGAVLLGVAVGEPGGDLSLFPHGDENSASSGGEKPSGVVTIQSGKRSETAPHWTSDKDNVSAICVYQKATLQAANPQISTSGDTTSYDKSEATGLNAALLAGGGAHAILKGGSISTTGAGASGLFAAGAGSLILLADGLITTSGEGSHGAMAVQGGQIRLDHVEVSTTRAHAAALATGRDGGTISLRRGKAVSRGIESPAIYSTGSITVEDSAITGQGAEAAVVEGALTLRNTSMTSGCKCGVRIFPAGSGGPGGGTFDMAGGSIDAAMGPLFYVRDAKAAITLARVAVNARSGILLDASAPESTKSGARVELKATAQALQGDVLVDAASAVRIRLAEGSQLTGTVRGAALSLDRTSHWSVTANSVITSLVDEMPAADGCIGNITGNGHDVVYDPQTPANAWLGKKSYALMQGGHLLPAQIVAGAGGSGR